jgi:NAD(P)-dependent dehydrogenase (short-subunit alcohol dehydrogenase family)
LDNRSFYMPERRPRLEGKVAIVTGAGSSGPGLGNGKATSLLFAREGAKVLLVDAVLERAEETLAMIHEEGGEAWA